MEQKEQESKRLGAQYYPTINVSGNAVIGSHNSDVVQGQDRAMINTGNYVRVDSKNVETLVDSDSKGVDAFEIVVPDKKLCRKLMKHIGLREG